MLSLSISYTEKSESLSLDNSTVVVNTCACVLSNADISGFGIGLYLGAVSDVL